MSPNPTNEQWLGGTLTKHPFENFQRTGAATCLGMICNQQSGHAWARICDEQLKNIPIFISWFLFYHFNFSPFVPSFAPLIPLSCEQKPLLELQSPNPTLPPSPSNSVSHFVLSTSHTPAYAPLPVRELPFPRSESVVCLAAKHVLTAKQHPATIAQGVNGSSAISKRERVVQATEKRKKPTHKHTQACKTFPPNSLALRSVACVCVNFTWDAQERALIIGPWDILRASQSHQVRGFRTWNGQRAGPTDWQGSQN